MKKTFFKLKFITAIMLLIGFAVFNIASVKAQVVASGDCGANGNNLTWNLTSNGVLTIEGSGAMEDYDRYGAPWDYIMGYQILTLVIGNNVTTIGDNAFGWSHQKITSVTLPNSITSIGEESFYLCRGLTSIDFGNSLISIGKRAFVQCNSLTSLTIPNSVKTIDIEAFSNCEGLKGTLTIPNSVTTIGYGAFAYCEGLTSVIIGNSVRAIGSTAFAYCTKLTSITIPSSVITIGNCPFLGCYLLTEINVDANNNNYSSIDGVLYNKQQDTLLECPIAKTGTVSIPNSVAKIVDNAFRACKLTSLIIGNSVASIGQETFLGCSDLTSITSKAVNPPATSYRSFYYVPVNIPVSVPCSSENAYKQASGNYGWKDFINYTNCINNTGLNDIAQTASIRFYPNPTTGELRIDNGEMMIESIEIYDLVGRVVFKSPVSQLSQETTIDVSHLSSGIYFLKVAGKTVKIIKN